MTMTGHEIDHRESRLPDGAMACRVQTPGIGAPMVHGAHLALDERWVDAPSSVEYSGDPTHQGSTSGRAR